MKFNYIKKNHALTPSQESLLSTVERLTSPFEGIKRLGDLRIMIGLKVVVADRDYLKKILEDSIRKIENQLEGYRNDTNNGQRILRQIEDFYSVLEWAREQLREQTLLGLYSRKLLWFDDDRPTVYLFADNIYDYARRVVTNVDNVFAYVFIHEMMHAYYDSFYSDGFPSREPLEEAFAEYGMLTFINKNSAGLPGNLLKDACDHVKIKRKYGPREYGFGYDMFERTDGGNPGMINLYKYISNWIDIDVFRPWKGTYNYFSDIRKYKSAPSPAIADACFEGVKEILEYEWEKPSFIIKPGIRGMRPPVGTVSAYPVLDESSPWVLAATKSEWRELYPLIRENDFIQLFAEVMKVMKAEGFESYLSINGDRLVFLGKPFSKYVTTPTGPGVIPESICVKGTTVFPTLDRSIKRLPAGIAGSILYSLSILFDGMFTIVHESSGYSLYGPSSCLTKFPMWPGKVSSPSASTTATAPKKKRYDIRDKTTSRVLKTGLSMRRVPLFIIDDLCSIKKGISFSDLDIIFNNSIHPYNMSHEMGIVMLKKDVDNYYASRSDSKKRYFDSDPIVLATGEIVLVTDQWVEDNFDKFKKIADDLGYEVK